MNNIPSASAFSAYSVRQQANANNVANMNTQGFKAQRADLQEAPGQNGVEVSDIRQRSSENTAQVQAGEAQNNRNEQEQGQNQRTEGEQRSDTELSTEFVEMNQNRLAYSANAEVIQAEDQMSGEVLNKLV